jgi:CHASE2 domain-containing sensor protein
VSKLVILKIAEGSFEQGFAVTLQIGEESLAGQRFAFLPTAEVTGRLPPNLDISQSYQNWQSMYRRLGLKSRLHATKAQVTNVSLIHDCNHAAEALAAQLNAWLRCESFRPIREKWLEQLQPQETVRVILQAEPSLQRLPWHLWDVLERYRQTELAISVSGYEWVERSAITKAKIKILAILGNSQGIDVQADRAVLEQLPDADVTFLVEPERQTLNQQLWAESWDILFFAGHSISTADHSSGAIKINQTDSLTIPQLKYALKTAVERSLRLAIFNSCDGLGLARDLSDLQIPQTIVMREPVPDRVAQEFLKAFLSSFAQGTSFYLAVRAAREQLQGLEDRFPCATWLPVICQNPAEPPLTWAGLQGAGLQGAGLQASKQAALPAPAHPSVPQPASRLHRFGRHSIWQKLVLSSLLISAGVLGLRATGALQSLELTSFDLLMKLRPTEAVDPRLLIVTINAQERQTYGEEISGIGRISLSDRSLNQLLQQLRQDRASLIGLDLYRDFPISPQQPGLKQQYQQNDIIGVCKARFAGGDSIAPPPDLPKDRIGFSDFVTDTNDMLRRQLLTMTTDLIDANAACTAPYAFSVQLALRYLQTKGIAYQFTPAGELQVGNRVFHRLQAPTGAYRHSETSGNQVLLNYRANSSPARQVTLTDLLQGQVNPAVVQDRIVLLGVIDPAAGDIWKTPIDNQMPGVVAQAHMISQILSAVQDNRALLQFPPLWLEGVWIGIWALAGGGLGWRCRFYLLYLLVLAISTGVIGSICVLALINGVWLPLIPATLALWISSGAAQIYRIYRNQLQST